MSAKRDSRGRFAVKKKVSGETGVGYPKSLSESLEKMRCGILARQEAIQGGLKGWAKSGEAAKPVKSAKGTAKAKKPAKKSPKEEPSRTAGKKKQFPWSLFGGQARVCTPQFTSPCNCNPLARAAMRDCITLEGKPDTDGKRFSIEISADFKNFKPINSRFRADNGFFIEFDADLSRPQIPSFANTLYFPVWDSAKTYYSNEYADAMKRNSGRMRVGCDTFAKLEYAVKEFNNHYKATKQDQQHGLSKEQQEPIAEPYSGSLFDGLVAAGINVPNMEDTDFSNLLGIEPSIGKAVKDFTVSEVKKMARYFGGKSAEFVSAAKKLAAGNSLQDIPEIISLLNKSNEADTVVKAVNDYIAIGSPASGDVK
jgi:hypothetical protein